MSKRLAFLNLILLAGLLALGWQARERYVEADARAKALLSQKAPAPPLRPLAEQETAPPITPSEYIDVAQKLVFAPDRNPDVAIEAAPEKPVPPFPVAHGVMDLGAGPTVILSQKSGDPQKGYRKGDQVGPFTLASLSGQDLVLEWEGKQFPKTIAELKVKEKPPQEQASAASSSPTNSDLVPRERRNENDLTPKEDLEKLQKPTGSLPGIDTGGAELVCAPGDQSPPGTVMGGYRKVVTTTPFGKNCRWVPAR
ncbi:MAG: hypothetical protein FJW20_13720 [Acidimicrobiia bacterium]|nr:hypothetical protein [Acidimicrobiia bacterium]